MVDASLRSTGIDTVGDVGKQVILPPTITGSPRWYTERYHDAMALVRKLGKPSYFITMTCNSSWEEIKGSLLEGQVPSDRPDICCRVFHMKVNELMHDLLKKHVLGHVKSYFGTIEFQKRGLPHLHLLLIMQDEDRPYNAEKTDKAICAEIPSKRDAPKLFDCVKSHMIHGPCGVYNQRCPCMTGTEEFKTCSKSFPKEFEDQTFHDGHTYPRYQRRHPDKGGEAFPKTMPNREMMIDNRWVVPYNPHLLYKYNCHMNVENVASVAAVSDLL